jgi:acetolactate synthase-1/2/3 large subunit
VNVAEFFVELVRRLGTDTVFSVTGGMAMHVNRAVAESSLKVIYCNHEQAVVAAADGYAKARNYAVPGVAVVTSGPGVMNTVNSVASAYYDSVPLIVIAGQVKTSDINRHGVRSHGAQETPQLDVLRPITKEVLRYDPRDVSDEALAYFMLQSLAGRKGPVFLEVPLDVQPLAVAEAERRLDAVAGLIAAAGAAADTGDSPAAREALEALAVCRRPALVLGNGLHIASVPREVVRRLVERVGAPVLFTWPSADLLEHAHDLNFGCPGGLAPTHANSILQQADVVLFLGVRLDLLTTAFNPGNFGKRARRIVVDCDPREIAKNEGLRDAVFFREDLRRVVSSLSELGGDGDRPPAHAEEWAEWLSSCRRLRDADRAQESAAFSAPNLTSYTMTRTLAEAPSVRYVVPTGSGYAVEGFARFFRAREGVTVAFAGHCLGSMGLALPMAIGAAAADDHSVICLEGDGGLLFNLQELYTLVANPTLKVRIVIMNNGGYQSIIRSQRRAFGKEFGASADSGLCAPRFDLLAAAVGMPYTRCDTVAELAAALASNDHRQIIDAFLEEDGYRGPAVMTKFDAEGRPYSTDIEDISWSR